MNYFLTPAQREHMAQAEALHRCELKRYLRGRGVPVHADTNTEWLEQIYNDEKSREEMLKRAS